MIGQNQKSYFCNAVKEINLFWRYGPHCAVCVCVCVCLYCYTYVDQPLTSHLSCVDIFTCVDVCVFGVMRV